MNIELIDKLNNVINFGDIVKTENFETNKVFYYLYGKDMLYKYNKQGEIEEDSLNNIKVDKGISLVNDDVWQWTRLGKKEEVYNSLFKDIGTP